MATPKEPQERERLIGHEIGYAIEARLEADRAQLQERAAEEKREAAKAAKAASAARKARARAAREAVKAADEAFRAAVRDEVTRQLAALDKPKRSRRGS